MDSKESAPEKRIEGGKELINHLKEKNVNINLYAAICTFTLVIGIITRGLVWLYDFKSTMQKDFGELKSEILVLKKNGAENPDCNFEDCLKLIQGYANSYEKISSINQVTK